MEVVVTAIGSEKSGKEVKSKNVMRVAVNVVAPQAVDVTPTGLNHLPFGPQDVLNIGFTFEAKLDKGDIDSSKKFGAELRAKNETFLIDDTSCVFYSRFSIFESGKPYGWSSTCGNTIRLDSSKIATELLGLDKSSTKNYVRVTEKSAYGTAYWDYSDSSAWRDTGCLPSHPDDPTYSQPIELGSGHDFGLRFWFTKASWNSN